jgi:molybdenum cofactor biosynthesis enzyme MoaA
MKKSKKFITLNETLEYIKDWFIAPSRRRGQSSLPTVLNLPITDNCNSRCVMCNVWKNKSTNELESIQLSNLLKAPFFQKLKHVGISGGEPTLRGDLVDIVSTVCNSLPALHSLSITSHGFHVKRWEQLLPLIIRICNEQNVLFTLNLSLDGIDQTHDAVRGIQGGYRRVMSTFELAQNAGAHVEFQATISKKNIFNIVRILYTIHKKLNTDIEFRLATKIRRLNNLESMEAISLDFNERSFFADFLTSPALLNATSSPARRLFYKDLAQRLITGTQRKAPCYYQNEGLLLTAHGEMYHCSVSNDAIGVIDQQLASQVYFSPNSQKIRTRLLNESCKTCYHDQSGAWSPGQLIGEVLAQTRFGMVLSGISKGVDILRSLLKALWLSLYIFLARKKMGNRYDGSILASALCIGMYGGEHVGDAAILGGVLLRAHKQLGIRQVYVASIRPDRTRRWISTLHLPLEIKVVTYQDAKKLSNQVNCLIHAGGPIMDLPWILTRQMEIVSKCV